MCKLFKNCLVVWALGTLVGFTGCAPGPGEAGTGYPTWSRSMGNSGNDELVAIAASDDRIFLTGKLDRRVDREAGGSELLAVALDGTGQIRWERAIGGQGDGEGIARGFAMDSGRAWIVGEGASGRRIKVWHIDETGIRFSRELPLAVEGFFETGWAIAPRGDGAIVAGWAQTRVIEVIPSGHPEVPDEHYSVPRWQLRTIALDAAGEILWSGKAKIKYTDESPHAVHTMPLSDGGALTSVRVEGGLQLLRLLPGGEDHEWVRTWRGDQHVVGMQEVSSDAYLLWGQKGDLRSDGEVRADSGFAARLRSDGSVDWQNDYGEVDGFVDGLLVCPPAGSCHLALLGSSGGAAQVLRLALDGSVDSRTAVGDGSPPLALEPSEDDTGFQLLTGSRSVPRRLHVLDASLATRSTAEIESGIPRWVGFGGGKWWFLSRGDDHLILDTFTPDGRQVQEEGFSMLAAARTIGVGVVVLEEGVLVLGEGHEGGTTLGVRFDPAGNILWQRHWQVGGHSPRALTSDGQGGAWFLTVAGLHHVDATGQIVHSLESTAPLVYLESILHSSGRILVVGRKQLEVLDAVTGDRLAGRSNGFSGTPAARPAGWAIARQRGVGTVELLWLDLEGAPEHGVTVQIPDVLQSRHYVPLTAMGDTLVLGLNMMTEDAGRDVVLVAVEGDDILWVRRYGGLLDDEVRSLLAPPEGGLILAGSSDNFGEAREGWVMRLDSEGLVSQLGACQAEREAPVVTLAPLTLHDSPAPSFFVEVPDRSASRESDLSVRIPELVQARQCSGFATSPEEPVDPGPPVEFEIIARVDGSEVSPGTALAPGTQVTLRASGPEDLSSYTFRWLDASDEGGAPLGEGEEFELTLEVSRTIRLLVEEEGSTVWEGSIELRVLGVIGPGIDPWILVCPSATPFVGDPVELRARVESSIGPVPATDHPRVARIHWVVRGYAPLNPPGLDPGPRIEMDREDSLLVIDPDTLTEGAFYEATATAHDAAGEFVATVRPTIFQVSGTRPEVSPGCDG